MPVARIRKKWTVGEFLDAFFQKFSEDETSTLAASLAFYTTLSLAPLLILFVLISSQISEGLQADFLSQIHWLVGPEAAASIEIVMESAKDRTDLASVSGLVTVLTWLLSASLIFGEMRSALDRIFKVPAAIPNQLTYWQTALYFARQRVLHIGLVLSFLFTLIVSLVASSVISATLQSSQAVWFGALNAVISLGFNVGLFSLLFRYLPHQHQPWRQALRGGFLTAIFFVIGKELIGLYLGSSALGSSYGAAGSVVVLLVWVYYSTMTTFIGAQVSTLWNMEEQPRAKDPLDQRDQRINRD